MFKNYGFKLRDDKFEHFLILINYKVLGKIWKGEKMNIKLIYSSFFPFGKKFNLGIYGRHFSMIQKIIHFVYLMIILTVRGRGHWTINYDCILSFKRGLSFVALKLWVLLNNLLNNYSCLPSLV